MHVAEQDRREFTTKDTKDGICLKHTSAIGQVQEGKEIVVSLDEARSPKLDGADHSGIGFHPAKYMCRRLFHRAGVVGKLLTLQGNRP